MISPTLSSTVFPARQFAALESPGLAPPVFPNVGKDKLDGLAHVLNRRHRVDHDRRSLVGGAHLFALRHHVIADRQ